MGLAEQEYKALEDIVGSEYISREPAICDTYNQVWGNKLVFGEKWSTRPAAVLLPGSTEEVQAIVRVCNKYRIPFKPFSSGFEIVSTALESERGILLDLRRMDRILEIDVKNMHAIVEPYVSIYRLQIELAKYGLFVSTVGCGPSAGVVASSCCHFGAGGPQVFTGGPGRNVLGAEWVLPTGDIMRLGAGGTGDGWFSADGPGISLRGILRGHSGANGGHGVITKACVKLYPWYGSPEWKFTGQPPGIKTLEKVPDGFKVFVISFPTSDNEFEALREIAQAEIAFVVREVLQVLTLTGDAEGNDEIWEGFQNAQKEQNPELREAAENCLGVILATNSSNEMKYREQYLLKVAERWGGVLIPRLNEPKVLAKMFASAVWSFGVIAGALRLTTEIFYTPNSDGTMDMCRKLHEEAVKTIEPYAKSGAIFPPTGAPVLILGPYENYSVGAHTENTYHFDPYDPDSLAQTRKLIDETLDPQSDLRRYGVPSFGAGLQIESVQHIHQKWGPLYDNYEVWLTKIKAALDPNNVGDWSGYIPPVFP